MKITVSVIVIALFAGAAHLPAQRPVKTTSLYCELQLRPKGQTMVRHPFPLLNLKDGQQVPLRVNGMGSGVDVTFSDIDGYPSITIDESDRRGLHTLSVDGSVEHSLTLNETDARGNFTGVLCQPVVSDVAR